MLLKGQAAKSPDSKSSAKITSEPSGVFVGVEVVVLVREGVTVDVAEEVGVRVKVGVEVDGIQVAVGVRVGVFVGVPV